jgi:O-antigen ligase
MSVAMVSASGLAFFLGLNAQRWGVRVLILGSTLLMVHIVLFSFSRGAMLGLIATALVGFWLMSKRPVHYLTLALAVTLSIRLAGSEVRQEFMTVFAEKEERDFSAQSRLDLWSNAWDSILKRPILGVGPDHFPLIAKEYGWPAGKEVHNLWFQLGAELGLPGLLLLLSFYSLCIARLWSLLSKSESVADPWLCDAARMVIVSLLGFSVAAFFVSLEGLEVPYYIVLIGAGVLKLSSLPNFLGTTGKACARTRSHANLTVHRTEVVG